MKYGKAYILNMRFTHNEPDEKNQSNTEVQRF